MEDKEIVEEVKEEIKEDKKPKSPKGAVASYGHPDGELDYMNPIK